MGLFLLTGLLLSTEIYNGTDAKMPPAHEQLRNHPSIDEVVCHNLEGEALKEALFIIDNIRENKMKINWSAVNVWSVQYKHKHVCDLSIEKGKFVIGKLSDALITYVKDLSYEPQTTNPLFDALIDFVNGKEKALAMQ